MIPLPRLLLLLQSLSLCAADDGIDTRNGVQEQHNGREQIGRKAEDSERNGYSLQDYGRYTSRGLTRLGLGMSHRGAPFVVGHSMIA